MRKKIKAAIIDKDGTLTESISGATFVQSPTDQKLIDGVQEAIAKLISQGYTLAIASNQAGVEAGHKSLEDAIAEMLYVMELIPQIEIAFFCPSKAGQDSYCHFVRNEGDCIQSGILNDFEDGYRKPNAGMLIEAIKFAANGEDIDEIEAIMIGDRPEDKLAAQAANTPFTWAKDWWIK